jgi:SOS-response transcriptional repressor LexA
MDLTICAHVSKKQYAVDATCRMAAVYNCKMENIADRLRAKMKEKGFSQYRLWKLSGVSQPTIGRILDKTSRAPDRSTIDRLAAALGCSYAELYDGSSSSSVITEGMPAQKAWESVAPLTVRTPNRLPVIAWAGVALMRTAENPYSVLSGAIDWKDSPFPAGPNAFLLPVIGDAMYSPDGSGYANGEMIQVDPSVAPTDGCDVVVVLLGDVPVFRRYCASPEGVYLEARNPGWPDRVIRLPPDAFICGVVTASWRDRTAK